MNREWASTRKEIFEGGVVGTSFIVNAPMAPPGLGWTLRAAITYQQIVIWYWERDINEYNAENKQPSEKETIVIGDESVDPNPIKTQQPRRR